MGKRKGLEEAWRGPQYTFRSEEPEGNEETREPAKEEIQISSNEEKRNSSNEEKGISSNEVLNIPSHEDLNLPSSEEKRKVSKEERQENANPLRKFNAMLPEELFFEWKTYCTKKRCKMQDLTAQALSRYMKENP